ncbi:Catalyzes the cleavage of p-aminobenzoyl-glutamate to p-aminobenzoate and glutamate, subunit A [Lunatimonas lonarensis]|uniref:Catalyzes the cleavage of p-aminobenzoyl-glutamate to p-aminobenzoate and glutamate, subunit A n=1 Tax=Lunatimonas lonarensis TaxID=1232681 RepID=R7ZU18_9BACT|nr:amidohydrolase [Lunatimonas lonarensis]EON77494.1 Catalyzes the cleavage of p-aminobenzoyl-glutamate to p-aminobenzoate and glutamate, subunit A [Lunatimonas lonarensis]
MQKRRLVISAAIFLLVFPSILFAQIKESKIIRLKADLLEEVEKQEKLIQVMVDKVYSFSEMGFQEVETSNYLTGVLEEHGFAIKRGVAGMPTAWTATWGSGKPFIAIGSDIDGLPNTSQTPGVAYHKPLVKGAPGHGEGHNSGVPLSIAAAISLKNIMDRENIQGTLMIWPGVAEEQLAGKAYLVRSGIFAEADACIFTHVSSNLGVSWGDSGNNGLVSVRFDFEGQTAHGASAWNGSSALDGVELMNAGWNFYREHLPPTQRSHYVIMDGGDQPNVVPATASVWYFLRERTYEKILGLYEDAIRIAEGAAMMTKTSVTHHLMGSSWPGHFNKAIAEAMQENIQKVGLPTWSEEDQQLAKAVQKHINPEKGDNQTGLLTEIGELRGPATFSMGGGSDDIGDVSWNLPTVVLRYPANAPDLPGHHWTNGVAMATPIAHKGVMAGAKVEALTVLDLLLKPKILEEAWIYFREVQTKSTQYKPLMAESDEPAIFLNERLMDLYRPQLEKLYYDETKYDTYLEQLGVTYPTLE